MWSTYQYRLTLSIFNVRQSVPIFIRVTSIDDDILFNTIVLSSFIRFNLISKPIKCISSFQYSAYSIDFLCLFHIKYKFRFPTHTLKLSAFIYFVGVIHVLNQVILYRKYFCNSFQNMKNTQI